MKHRSPIAVALLEVFTIGIHHLIWLHETRSEFVRLGLAAPSMKVPIVNYCASLATIGTLIVLAIAKNTAADFIFVLVAGIGLIGLWAVVIRWHWQYAQAAEKATNTYITAKQVFFLWCLLGATGLHFVWSGIMQHIFNRTIDPRGEKTLYRIPPHDIQAPIKR